MSRKWNLATAFAAFAGLALLAPVTLGSPQSAEKPKQQSAEQKKSEPCDCAALPYDFEVRIPDFAVDGEMIRRHIEEALAQAGNASDWKYDHERMLRDLRANLAGQQGQIRQSARAMADQARAMARGWASQDGPAIFIEDGENGWLGISISEVTAEKAKELKLPAERGVLVGDVEAESAAAKAGLKNGDVITEFNGQRVEGTVQFRRMVRETLAGRTVPVTVWREGRSLTLQVEMGSRQAQMRSRFGNRIFVEPDIRVSPEIRVAPRIQIFGSRTPTLGINGEDLEGELGKYFNAPDGEGVLVKQVFEGTPAEKAGLKAGDVITHIEGERIKSVSDLRATLREKREAKSVKVDLLRRGSAMSLNVEIEQPKPPAPRATARRVSA
jgi:serine protease Do